MGNRLVSPTLLPVAAIPIANDRRVEKYGGKTATHGTNKQAMPKPMHTPCASMNCQYLVQRLVIIMPKTVSDVPATKRLRRKPRSYIGPTMLVPMMNRHSCKDPIHEILDGVEFGNAIVS